MSQLTKLTPFWYEPEGQGEGEAISFHLRPLTQPQMVEVEEHYEDGKVTGKAEYVAGTLGIIAVKGLRHPETGVPAVPPMCFDWVPRGLVKACGRRLIVNDWGLDWDKIMKPLTEGEPPPDPKPHEDPEKN